MEIGLWAQLVLRALWFYFPGLSTISSFLALYWLFQMLATVPKGSYFYSPPSQQSTPASLRVHVLPGTVVLPALCRRVDPHTC